MLNERSMDSQCNTGLVRRSESQRLNLLVDKTFRLPRGRHTRLKLSLLYQPASTDQQGKSKLPLTSLLLLAALSDSANDSSKDMRLCENQDIKKTLK